MKAEYDFSNAIRNPYIGKLKKQVTIDLDVKTICYFEDQAKTAGIPYQALINQYLEECASNNRIVCG